MLDKALPLYMSIGMPYELYWEGEYGAKKAYREAYALRRKREEQIADQNNWYMGQYIISALQAVPLLVAGLNVKETTRLPKYPEKPFFEAAEEQKQEEQRKKKEEDRMKMAMAMFHAMATQFNKNFEQKQQEQSGGEAIHTGQ